MPKAPAKKKTESKKAAKPRAAKKAPASKPTKSSGKKLVVVESPAKAKTINRYLGSQYLVKASLGHIKDLPGKDLGVDVDQNFRPTYEPIPARAKVIQELKKAAGKASSIYLAADPDREGEAICQHLAEELGNGKPVYRILFNEITKSAIQQAVENPVEVNAKLVDAQQTRRILDRLVGYKISPLLWDKVRRGLSAGRVQTVALRFVVEREREIEAFVKEEYWTLAAQVTGAEPPPFEARLVKRNGKDLVVRGESGSGSIQAQVDQGKILIRDEAEATRIQALLEKEKYVVSATATKQVKRNPTPPFVTAKLQQDASRKLGFSAKRTMGLAQKLYEGVEIGEEGTVGLITYMRTDSTRVSDSALADARAWIGNQYGDKYLPEKPNVYRSKKGAQDAHEAIRPTSAQLSPDRVAKYVGNDEAKLYRLIWQRFVASQMRPALFDQTSIEIQAGEFGLRTTGSVLKFDGFLKVYEEATDQKDDVAEGLGRRLPEVKQGQELVLVSVAPDQHFTEPPPRYNEASLVKVLEEKGIGRPSTYASILSTIQDREYVEKVKSRFFPTELGTVVADLLVENFKELFDPAYTARMEDSLDEIEEGKQKWVEMLGDFYGKFSKDLALAGEQMADIKRMQKPTDQVCEKCTKPMVIRWGRYGSFLACSGHPDCTNTRELPKSALEAEKAGLQEEDQQEDCQNCGKSMVLKRGRFGQFLACSGYPDCKTTRRIGQAEKKPPVPLEEKCPDCGNQLVLREGRFGEFTSCGTYPTCKYIKQETTGVECSECKKGQLVQKRSRRGKAFYSCNRYPKCKFSLWNKPVPKACPECKSPYLIEKTTKAGTTLACPNEDCKYLDAA